MAPGGSSGIAVQRRCGARRSLKHACSRSAGAR
jgi:hypothetical protein